MQSTVYKIEMIAVIATIALMLSIINTPTQSARRPPSSIAPAVKLMSGVKACTLFRASDVA